tara:strand:- start:268 stop:384 length:117 start_codon:yes stop_codon:yes gene_type:complete
MGIGESVVALTPEAGPEFLAARSDDRAFSVLRHERAGG